MTVRMRPERKGYGCWRLWLRPSKVTAPASGPDWVVGIRMRLGVKAGRSSGEESGWKVFPQGVEGTYCGIQGELLPGREITPSFTFGIVAPDVLLMFVYPSKTTCSSWDEDDLICT